MKNFGGVLVFLVVCLSAATCLGANEDLIAVLKIQGLVEAGVNFEDYRDAVIEARAAAMVTENKNKKAADAMVHYEAALKYWSTCMKNRYYDEGWEYYLPEKVQKTYQELYIDLKKHADDYFTGPYSEGMIYIIDYVMNVMLNEIWHAASKELQ